MRRMVFSAAEDEFIRQFHRIYPAYRLSKMLGRHVSAVGARLRVLKLVVPPDIVDKFRREGRLQKGHIPHSTGKKAEEFMSAEGLKNFRAKHFKKGYAPLHALKDLDIRTKKKQKGYYKVIRINGKWIYLQRYVWEQIHGTIAKGMLIMFKDGDSMNCHIDNLELVTLEEKMNRYSSWNMYPKEVANVILLKGVVKRTIKQQNKILKDGLLP